MVAPTRTPRIIADVFPVSRTQEESVLKESFLLKAARIIAHIAPNPAASVGVAVPVAMEPKTVRISASGATKSRKSASANDPPSGGFVVAGASLGLVIAMKII